MNSSAKNRKNYIELNIHIIINVIYFDTFFASYFYFFFFYFKTKNEKYRVPISTKEAFNFISIFH